jgi:hypothetical protein
VCGVAINTVQSESVRRRPDRRFDRRQPVLGVLAYLHRAAVGGERPGVDPPDRFSERRLAGPLGREPADPPLAIATGVRITLSEEHEAVGLPPLDDSPTHRPPCHATVAPQRVCATNVPHSLFEDVAEPEIVALTRTVLVCGSATKLADLHLSVVLERALPSFAGDVPHRFNDGGVPFANPAAMARARAKPLPIYRVTRLGRLPRLGHKRRRQLGLQARCLDEDAGGGDLTVLDRSWRPIMNNDERCGAPSRLCCCHFVQPAEEIGTGRLASGRAWATSSSIPHGLLLVDTGIGSDPEVDVHYRPLRHRLIAALAGAGVHFEDVKVVVNCHLHFDHCGGNPELVDRTIFTQRVERRGSTTAAGHGDGGTSTSALPPASSLPRRLG